MFFVRIGGGMIRVRIELVPYGEEHRAAEIGQIEINTFRCRPDGGCAGVLRSWQ